MFRDMFQLSCFTKSARILDFKKVFAMRFVVDAWGRIENGLGIGGGGWGGGGMMTFVC